MDLIKPARALAKTEAGEALIARAGILGEHAAEGAERLVADAVAAISGRAANAEVPLSGTFLTGDKGRVTDAVADLARVLTADRPQVNASGELQYYFSGSMASNLLARAGRYTELSAAEFPKVISGRTIDLSDRARDSFAHFVRPIGDVDVVNLPNAGIKYTKGGSGQSFGELPELARSAFKDVGSQSKIMFDPSKITVNPPIAVEVAGKPVYVADPGQSLAFKMLHGMESLAHVSSTKLTGDFENLYTATGQIRSRDELVQIARRTMEAYNKTGSGLYLHDYDPLRWNGQIKSFADDIIAMHPDSKYVADLGSTRTWAPSLLETFAKLPEGEKGALAGFVKRNRQHVENWITNTDNELNQKMAAEYIFSNRPDLMQRLSRFSETDGAPVSLAQLTHNLARNPWALHDVAPSFPPGTLAVKPLRSPLISALHSLDSKRVNLELTQIDHLVNHGVESGAIERAMNETVGAPEVRDILFPAWRQAADTLSPEKLGQVSYKATKALDEIWSDAKTPLGRIEQMRKAFTDVGIEVK